MSILKKAFCGIIILSATSSAFADSPKIGSPSNGGFFIYRHLVGDPYFVDWIAYPLMGQKELKNADSIHLTMIGEGKNSFIGNVNISCENGESEWETGLFDGSVLTSSSDIKEYVPDEAIKNSIRKFCKK